MCTENKEEKYLFWLCSIKGIRLSRLCALRECFNSAEEIYHAPREMLWERNLLSRQELGRLLSSREDRDWEEEWQEVKAREIRFVSYFHADYPETLRYIYQPPKRILIKGKLPDPDRLSIGIVGARDCTGYGRDMARMFGYRLAQNGVQIISGMARGIDAWGHQGALEGGGDTYAVLGSGVEVCYPASHRSLYGSIQKHGGVLSEFSIFSRAHPGFFPLRNRIISGLSQGLLVVEAREKSGSLITADAALEQGKDVFVVPGRIGDELSVGCNRLIRQGAVPVLSPGDILEYYAIEQHKQETKVTQREQNILSRMPGVPVHIDQLTDALKIPSTDVVKGLLQLQGRGEVEEVSRGYFMKKI